MHSRSRSSDRRRSSLIKEPQLCITTNRRGTTPSTGSAHSPGEWIEQVDLPGVPAADDLRVGPRPPLSSAALDDPGPAKRGVISSFGQGTEATCRRTLVSLTSVLPQGEDVTHWFR